MRAYFFGFILIFSTVFLFADASAQQPQLNYANELLRQGRTQDALSIYRNLLERNPGNVNVVDRAVTTLVSLKEFEEAVEILRRFINANGDYPNLHIRKAEIWHMAAKPENARQTWEDVLKKYPNNIQVYRLVSESMNARREYKLAAQTLDAARTAMGNQQLFAFEIAQNYTASGDYELAIGEYSRLLIHNPGFLHTIQRQISRFDDEYYRDAAILEFEERSRNLTPETEAWTVHRQMLIWLYMERGLFRRALATARNLEERYPERMYPVYDLGVSLFNLNEFDYAEDAFRKYTDNPQSPLYAESREQLALLYITRARYLLDNNLDFGTEAMDLYERGYSLLEDMELSGHRYQRRGEILVLLTEISLDHLRDPGRAEQWLSSFESGRRGDSDAMLADYLRGRIYMMRQDFSRARIALTRSNRAARTGELAEKTRYFLSLNDFYAGDFEFARIQMRALQRQHTSYYANDALRLRTWLQEGIIQDSVMAELGLYGKALYRYQSGQVNEALETLLPFFHKADSPLKTDALLLAGRIFRKNDPVLGFQLFDSFLRAGTRTAQKERLMWERARLADAIYHIHELIPEAALDQEILEGYVEVAFKGDDAPPGPAQFRDSMGISGVIALYEDLLMEFPQGFYGSPARERIRYLQQTTSTL